MILEVNQHEWYTYPHQENTGWVRVQVRERFKKGGAEWINFDSVQVGFGGSVSLETFLGLAILESTADYENRTYQAVIA